MTRSALISQNLRYQQLGQLFLGLSVLLCCPSIIYTWLKKPQGFVWRLLQGEIPEGNPDKGLVGWWVGALPTLPTLHVSVMRS